MIRSSKCAYCGNHSHNMTRDHIVPKAWGGCGLEVSVANNFRPACRVCNQRRGSAGHCVGTMACIRSVAKATNQHYATIERRWRLPTILSLPGYWYAIVHGMAYDFAMCRPVSHETSGKNPMAHHG